MRYIYIFFLLNISYIGFGQDINMDLVARVPLDETGNDIWGYVDDNGIEYAIMGSRTHTNIWSLEDKANPQLRARIQGGSSTWRDIKSWKTHLYVTNDETPDGLLVIDMSMAPDSISYNYLTPQVFTESSVDTFIDVDRAITVDTVIMNMDTTIIRDTMIVIDTIVTIESLGQCHNLYIDEFGYCYLAGCRISGGSKAIILDLNVDLDNPPIIAAYGSDPFNGPEYAHDLMVQNNIMYSSEIYTGHLTLFDVSDKSNIIELGDAQTTTNFTHNTWASTDGNYAFTTDERPNAYVDAFDVSDPANIKYLDSYRPLETEGRGVIPHNTHYHDGYLVTSWYTDGIVVIDGSRPDNLIKVGSYDTWPFGDGGFSGCWGAYPWLPSGYILASNMSNNSDAGASVGELYIFEPKYDRACFLEGTVTDVETGDVINNVAVAIEAAQLNEANTDAMGVYKTGLATAGAYMVSFDHPDYIPQTVEATINNGEVTILDVQLEKRPRVNVTIIFIDSETGANIPTGKISMTNSSREVNLSANADGEINASIFDETYNEVVAGAWGYKHFTISERTFAEGATVTVVLEPGYQDDFALDLGWTQNGDPQTGAWVRDTPIGTFRRGDIANIDADDPDDIGDMCYMTGNGGGGPGTDDVDRGITRLVSPPIDVSGYVDPILRYKAHFYTVTGNGQAPLNDTMFVRIFDTEPHTIEIFTQPTDGWTELREIRLKDIVDINEELIFGFVISDFFDADLASDGQHVVEGATDVFSIVEGETSSTADIEDIGFEVYPNPFDDQINVIINENDYESLSIYNLQGQIVYHTDVTSKVININEIKASGLYTIQLKGKDGTISTKKVVKE